MINTYTTQQGDTLILPFGLNPATIAGADYTSKLISEFDREMFKFVSVTNEELSRHMPFMTFADLCKYLGFMIPIAAGANSEYGHWEKDWHRQTLVVGEDGFTGTAGAGNDVEFDLDPATVFTDSDGNTFCYARLKQIVHFNFGAGVVVNARITDIQPSGGTFTITLTPDDSTVALLTLLGGDGEGAGNEYAIISNAYAEGSKQGTGTQRRNIRYTNQLQIIKEDDSVTGSFLTKDFRIEKVALGDGSGGSYYDLHGAKDAAEMMRMARDGAICVGTRNDNWTENDANNVRPQYLGTKIHSTQGNIPFALQNGHVDQYTPNTFGVTNIHNWDDLLDSEMAPHNYIGAMGNAFSRVWDNSIFSHLGDTVTNKYVAGSLFGGLEADRAEALAVSIQFNSISLSSGRTYHMRTIDSFHHPKGLGAGAYNYKDYYLLMPYAFVENNNSAGENLEFFGNMYDASKMPCFGYCYSAKRGYNREMEIWRTGAAGGEGNYMPNYTNDEDVLNSHFRGEFGAWCSRGNWWVVSDPQ